MTYREALFKRCDETDFRDENEAIRLVMSLAEEMITQNDVLTAHEEKLKELMSAKEWQEYASGLIRLLMEDWAGEFPEGLKDIARASTEVVIDDMFGDGWGME